MISWIERNGTWTAYNKGKLLGYVSQNPPDTFNEGFWRLSFSTIDGGVISFGPFYWRDEALDTLELMISLDFTYDKWMTEYPNGYPVTHTT